MFNTQHILYMVISGVLTAALLVLCRKYVKKETNKNHILKFFAIITVLIHISDAWVDYFATGGQATINSTHFFPIYPCNVVMWMLLIASLMHNKKHIVFQMLAEFCFWGGIICSTIGIVLNQNFGNNPTLADYDILKGLLSHSTMLFGCIYMLVGGFIRIRSFNALSVTAGLGIFVICGIVCNRLYEAFGMEPPDGMFLLSNPYLPISPILPGIGAVIILFFVLRLVEKRRAKKHQT